MNLREFTIPVLAGVGFVSAIVSLLTTRWGELGRKLRLRRSLLITALLAAAIAGGLFSIPLTPTSQVGTGQGRLKTDVTENLKASPPVDVSANTESTATVSVTAPPAPFTPTSDIRDTNGREIPTLVLVANDVVGAHRYRVQGTLTSHTTADKDDRLPGMITAHVYLSVTVNAEGKLIAAFSIESRGGGFDDSDAENQALERLAALFEKRLRKEIAR